MPDCIAGSWLWSLEDWVGQLPSWLVTPLIVCAGLCLFVCFVAIVVYCAVTFLILVEYIFKGASKIFF